MRRDERPSPTTWASASHGEDLDRHLVSSFEHRVGPLESELRCEVRRPGMLTISMGSVERLIRSGIRPSYAGSHRLPATAPDGRSVRELMTVELIRSEKGRRDVRGESRTPSCELLRSSMANRCELLGRLSGSRRPFRSQRAGRMPIERRRWPPSLGCRHHGLSHLTRNVVLPRIRMDDRFPTSPENSSCRLAWVLRHYGQHLQPTNVTLHLSRTDDRLDPQNLADHSDATMNLCDQPFVESTPSLQGIRLPLTERSCFS